MLSMMTRERKGSQAVIQHFPLPGILPEGQTLALQQDLGMLALIASEGEEVRMLASLRFTHAELAVLVPLLDAYPEYCPSEVLHAHFYSNAEQVSEGEIEKSRAIILEACEQGSTHVERIMRPVRNVISRVRLKLHAVGIDILSMLETGYLLRKQRGARRRRRSGQEENGKGANR